LSLKKNFEALKYTDYKTKNAFMQRLLILKILESTSCYLVYIV